MKRIENRVRNTGKYDWRKFEFLQPEGFKDITKQEYELLVDSIKANDFVETFKVWMDSSTKVVYCLDGYHRCMALRELEKQGYDVPYELHCEFIECEDKQEASMLVMVYSSRFAKLTSEGVKEHLEKYDLDLNDLPGLDKGINQILEEIREGLDVVQPEIPRGEIEQTVRTEESGVDTPPEPDHLVTLYFKADEFRHFTTLTGILKKEYNQEELSKTILEALKVASLNGKKKNKTISRKS